MYMTHTFSFFTPFCTTLNILHEKRFDCQLNGCFRTKIVLIQVLHTLNCPIYQSKIQCTSTKQ